MYILAQSEGQATGNSERAGEVNFTSAPASEKLVQHLRFVVMRNEVKDSKFLKILDLRFA